MRWPRLTDIHQDTLWSGWRRWAVWSVCAGVFFALGALRTGTDAEMTFASFALLPVLVIAWLGGKGNGLVAAALAAGTWVVADLASDRQFSEAWIPWANAATRLVSYGIVAILAAQVRLQFEREHQRATKDVLTGLWNRRAFLEAGRSEVARARRHVRPLAVVFLDLDDFKKLNDSRGHGAGDAALRVAGAALRDALRSNDQVARLGGDEFAALLPETGYDEAADAGARLRLAVNDALRDFTPVKASVGIAWFAKADLEFPEMLKAADDLMYEAKKTRLGEVRIGRFAAQNARSADARTGITKQE